MRDDISENPYPLHKSDLRRSAILFQRTGVAVVVA
jgi:hypothetical protein